MFFPSPNNLVTFISIREYPYMSFLSSVTCSWTVTFVCPLSPRFHLLRCHRCPVEAFLSLASSNTFGNNTLKGITVYHWSCQKDTLPFLPVLNDILEWKISFVFNTHFQKADVLDVLWVSPHHSLLLGLYLSCNSFCNCPPGFVNMPHHHLVMRARLKVFRSKIPNTPSFLAYILAPSYQAVFCLVLWDPTL